MPILKVFRVTSEKGYTFEISETNDKKSIRVSIENYAVALTEQEWYELCELRYRLDVKTPIKQEETENKTEKEPNNADESI